jgi:hypothetical protein
MFAMPGLRALSLTPKRASDGVSCDEQGVFVGDVPLLRRCTGSYGHVTWSVRTAAELNDELTALYRLPVDVAAKAGALALIAAAFDRGDLAMAAIAAGQMRFPDPSSVSRGVETNEDLIRHAAELRRSGLLKFWDPAKHPRTGTPPNPGEFATVGGQSESAPVIPVADDPNRPGYPGRPPLVESGGGGGPFRGGGGSTSGGPGFRFPSVRWPWSGGSPSEPPAAAPKPPAPVDAQPDLPFPEGLPRQRAPAADADIPAEDSPTEVPARGGRLGSPPVRAQNAEIAAELKDQGYTITRGGGEAQEEYIAGEGPGTKGSTYVDTTAVNETTGKTVRVQTVDTLADGITPTPREQAAIARIRQKFPNDELWIIPKR